MQETLIGRLIGLARATDGNEDLISDSTVQALLDGLTAAPPDHCPDDQALLSLIGQVQNEKWKLVPNCANCAAPCGRNDDFDMRELGNAEENIRFLKLQIVSEICAIAVCVKDSRIEVKADSELIRFICLALFAIGMSDWNEVQLMPILQKADGIRADLAATASDTAD